VPDSISRSNRFRALRLALAVVRWLLALVLGAAALAFLLHGRVGFARLGGRDEARIALGCAEMTGAGLFLFRRTMLAGAVVLLIVLSWAAGFHFARGLGSHQLWVYLSGVLALTAASHWNPAPSRMD
jgi:hypothetical protein